MPPGQSRGWPRRLPVPHQPDHARARVRRTSARHEQGCSSTAHLRWLAGSARHWRGRNLFSKIFSEFRAGFARRFRSTERRFRARFLAEKSRKTFREFLCDRRSLPLDSPLPSRSRCAQRGRFRALRPSCNERFPSESREVCHGVSGMAGGCGGVLGLVSRSSPVEEGAAAAEGVRSGGRLCGTGNYAGRRLRVRRILCGGEALEPRQMLSVTSYFWIGRQTHPISTRRTTGRSRVAERPTKLSPAAPMPRRFSIPARLRARLRSRPR